MSEIQTKRKEVYDVITIPLNAHHTNKAIPLDCDILVVGQIPISVTCRLNDVGNKSFDLAIFRRIDHPLKRIYITTTTTSTDSLILFASKGVAVSAIGYGDVVELTDSAGVRYDARDIVDSEIWSDNANINNGATDSETDIATTGYNKIVGWVFADRALTLNIKAALAAGGTYRTVDSIAIAASTGTAFDIPVVGEAMELELDNSSGGNTTTCERWFAITSGA